MSEKENKNKLTELAVKQQLLLWQLSKSFLEVEEKIKKSKSEIKIKS